MSTPKVEVIALSGGVGGAKLALGLQRTLPSGALAIVVNTGDDFEHLGLAISPDVDTTLYTLAGIADETRGWGRAGETWLAMAELERLGGPTWFRLGDKDLALHLERTRRLAAGEPPSVITADFARRLGGSIAHLSDDRRSRANVRRYQCRCTGVSSTISFAADASQNCVASSSTVRKSRGLLRQRSDCSTTPCLKAVLICPSNPYLSIDPILALPCWTTALRSARVPVIAVSPLVGGRAIKGPTTKIMAELGIAPDPTVAGAALCGSHRWPGHRPRGCTLGAIVWHSRDGDFHHHEQPGRSGAARSRGARVCAATAPDVLETHGMSVVAIVPFKGLDTGKQRLAACLSPSQRSLLNQRMLEDVLRSARAACVFDEIWVLSVEPLAASRRLPMAAGCGARPQLIVEQCRHASGAIRGFGGRAAGGPALGVGSRSASSGSSGKSLMPWS